MNWSEMQANWSGLKPLVQAHWQKITDSMLDDIHGDRAALAQALELHYGLSPADAETAICEFEADVRRPGAVK